MEEAAEPAEPADERRGVQPEASPLFRVSEQWLDHEDDGRIHRAVLLAACAKKHIATCSDSLATEQQRLTFKAAEISAPLVKVLLVLYMAAYFFEVPSWCWLEDEVCGDPDVVPRSPISSTLPLHSSRILQTICLCCFIGHSLTERHALCRWSMWQSVGVGVELFALLDVLVAMVNRYGLPPECIYWSPLLRPFVFLGQSRYLQRFLGNALPAMADRAIVDIILLQGLWLLVWAWFGLLLFCGSEEGSEYFDSYPTALLTLFTLFTTANFPDVMMIAYHKSRWVFAYFGTFLVVCLYGLFNVLLAALFNSYKARVGRTHESLQRRAEETLGLAFDSLEQGEDSGPGGGLGPRTWGRFAARLLGGSNGGPEGIELLFGMFADPDGQLQLETFLIVVPELVAERSGSRRTERAQDREPLMRLLGALHWLVDGSVVLSLALTVAQTRDFLEHERPIWETAWELQVLHFTVCVGYLAEAALRVAVLGVGQLLSFRWLADVSLALSSGVLECLLDNLGPSHYFWQSGWSHRALGRALVLLRAARVERVLWRFSGPRATLQMLVALVGTFRSAGAAMFFLFYLYSTVGVQVFGGLVRVDAPQLQRSDFATAGRVGYWANNFNDFASGCVVLFELMVVNNWYIVANGLALVAPGTSFVGWLFCISFYFCMHIVILNVLVTSVVESYERLRASKERTPTLLEHMVSLSGQSAEGAAQARGLLLEPVEHLSGNRQGWEEFADLDEGLLIHHSMRRSRMSTRSRGVLRKTLAAGEVL